jgi:hypothetical protein
MINPAVCYIYSQLPLNPYSPYPIGFQIYQVDFLGLNPSLKPHTPSYPVGLKLDGGPMKRESTVVLFRPGLA